MISSPISIRPSRQPGGTVSFQGIVMSVQLIQPGPDRDDPSSVNATSGSSHRPERADGSGRELAIGLLNNMPDGALAATERQFISLLSSAAEGLPVRLTLYYLPEVPRSEAARRHLDQTYCSAESLWNAELDGLIVTGREPLASSMADEPYWNSFVRVLEWARENTSSTVWSCLAAHAAVLHMDGIQRARSSRKHCGIFDCSRVSDHAITHEVPVRFRSPHSRWNGLREADLRRCGYQVLALAGEAGVDCFIKQDSSLFLFFQGHPEYEPDTILQEYRRDVVRFLRGESNTYPSYPRGYFDTRTLQELQAIRATAGSLPQTEMLARLDRALASVGTQNGWHATARILYRNWLRYIHAAKELRHEKTDAAEMNVPLNAPDAVGRSQARGLATR